MSRPDRVDFAILSPIPEEWNAVCSKLDAQRHPESEVLPTKVGVIGEHTTGNPMLKWTLRVLAPRHVNRLMWRNRVFTRNTLKFVKTDLHICGLDLEKLSDLPRNLSKLLDVKLEVTKKTKGDNENIYFTSRIVNDRTPGKFRQ